MRFDIPRRMLAGLLVAAALVALSAHPVAAVVISEEWALNWQDDLRFFARQLPRAHPDPFTRLSQEEFEARIDELIEAAPEQTHQELVVGLARIVAALGDGHTRLTLPLAEGSGFFLGHSKIPPPHIPGLTFAALPVRLVWLDDGLVVSAADREHGAMVGARVERIGEKTAAEAIELVSPVVHRDNVHQLRYQLPDYLVLPDVLAAVGIGEAGQPVALTLAPASGEPFTVRLEPTAAGRPIDWVEVGEGGAEPPLFRRHNDRKFWFEHLEEERAVYFQYNEVGDEEEETLATFVERLFAFIDRNRVDKLIIDLRRNRGGNNGLNQPILHGLIRHQKLRRPGSLFVLTGGGTFSAAMMFSIDLAEHTPALFVGSPTGSSPNHFGDSRKIRLPRTGLTVRVSSLYWQYSDPRDDRREMAPHLPVPSTVADYRSGRDAALEAVLSPGPRIASAAAHAGVWRGRLTAFRWTFEVSVDLEHGPSGWAGTMDVPDLELDGAPLEGVEVGDGRVRFVLPFPQGDREFLFEGRTEGRRIYGFMGSNSRQVPFVLSLEPSG